MSDYLQQSHQPPALQSLKQYNLITYCLYAASLFVGITCIIAIIMNYIKREEMRGTWLESHVEWQIKTFWYGFLGMIIGGVLSIILIGFLVITLVGIWYIYRIIKGFIVFMDNKPIGNGFF